MRITRKMAKAILKSPNFGEIHDLCNIAWVKKTVYNWPSCQPKIIIDIYVDDALYGRCDLSRIRKIAEG